MAAIERDSVCGCHRVGQCLHLPCWSETRLRNDALLRGVVYLAVLSVCFSHPAVFSVSLRLCLSVCLSLCVCVSVSVCVSVCLSLSASLCLSVSVS